MARLRCVQMQIILAIISIYIPVYCPRSKELFVHGVGTLFVLGARDLQRAKRGQRCEHRAANPRGVATLRVLHNADGMRAAVELLNFVLEALSEACERSARV